MSLINAEKERITKSLAITLLSRIGPFLDAMENAFYKGEELGIEPPVPTTAQHARKGLIKLINKMAEMKKEELMYDRQLKEYRGEDAKIP